MNTYFKNLIALSAVALMMLAACASCAPKADMDVDNRLDEISAAMAYGDYDQAQNLCDDLLKLMSQPSDTSVVTESQAGMLGIIYMKLSEYQREDENVADATLCVRQAYRLSSDSLKAFSASLPLDDQRHFVLLRRIGLSIDNPVDLTREDIAHEDSLVAF